MYGDLVFAGLGVVWWLAAGLLLALGIAFARRLARWSLARRMTIHGLKFGRRRSRACPDRRAGAGDHAPGCGREYRSRAARHFRQHGTAGSKRQRKHGWPPPSVCLATPLNQPPATSMLRCSDSTTACGACQPMRQAPWTRWMPTEATRACWMALTDLATHHDRIRTSGGGRAHRWRRQQRQATSTSKPSSRLPCPSIRWPSDPLASMAMSSYGR